MKCRSLVLDKTTGKQNIVWFGSYGLIPPLFNDVVCYEKVGNNYNLVENEPLNWETNYQDYYQLETLSQHYKEWEENKYYEKNNNNYELLTSKPADWETDNYRYYLITSIKRVKGNAKKTQNYSEKQKGVAASLIQRLSVIKGELWYKASYGLPLMDKIKNKGIYDSIIIDIISSHPDVTNIITFESSLKDRSYQLTFVVFTIYGEELKISYII